MTEEAKEVMTQIRSDIADKLHQVKDGMGRNVNAMKGANKLHQVKDGMSRSVFVVQNLKKIHQGKDGMGRSVTRERSERWNDRRENEQNARRSTVSNVQDQVQSL
mmetsp:Transcript_40270/g.45472  ORF Transcript_40270/g.45472 Transcript_40270/m.45472 type:complete len:105 (-) Transcript_40270:60-374(-)